MNKASHRHVGYGWVGSLGMHYMKSELAEL